MDDLASHYKSIINLLGEDTEREGLQKTPMRVAKAMQVLTRGYSQDPQKVLTDALFKEDYSQMVVVKDIDVFSLCEHHMLPFYGKAHVAYIPNGYITGLSKIARVVDIFSHRLQVQERLTQQIRECMVQRLLDALASPAGAGATHTADTRVHRANAAPTRRDGCDRGKAHVYADARCGEAKLYNHDERLLGSIRAGEDAPGVYEPHQLRLAQVLIKVKE